MKRRFLKESMDVHFISNKLMRKAYEYIKVLRRRIFGSQYRKGRNFSENQYRGYMLRKTLSNIAKSNLQNRQGRHKNKDV